MKNVIMTMKLLVRKNKSILGIILILQVAICFSLNYMYAKNISSQYEYSSYDSDMRAFTVDLDNSLSISDIKTMIYPLQNQISYVRADIDTQDEYYFSCFPYGEESALTDISKNFSLSREIDYKEWCSGKYILLAVDNLYKYSGSRDYLTKFGDEFEIIGFTDSYLYQKSVIPNSIGKKYTARSLKIELKSIPRIDEITRIHYDLLGIFGGTINDPIEKNYTFEEAVNDSDIISYVMIIAAFATQGYFYIYFIKRCRKEFEIFELLGSTSLLNSLYLYVSLLLLTMVQILITDSVYLILFKPIIKKIDIITYMFSNIKTIATISICIISAVTITSLIIFAYTIQKSSKLRVRGLKDDRFT